MESLLQVFALIFFVYLMYQVMKYVFKMLLSLVNIAEKTSSRSEYSHFLSVPIRTIFSFIVNGKSNNMMGKLEASKFLSPLNKGILLDGQNKRLSPKDSFNHMAIIARTGGGKTTSYIIPNIFKLAQNNNSMIITDLSGELYEKTSGYLKKKGFKIHVLFFEEYNLLL